MIWFRKPKQMLFSEWKRLYWFFEGGFFAATWSGTNMSKHKTKRCTEVLPPQFTHIHTCWRSFILVASTIVFDVVSTIYLHPQYSDIEQNMWNFTKLITLIWFIWYVNFYLSLYAIQQRIVFIIFLALFHFSDQGNSQKYHNPSNKCLFYSLGYRD